VGRGQLHERLRADERVTSLERTDIRSFRATEPYPIVVADLSLEQTADVVGKRVGAVKALQHRALATMRRLLEQAVSL